jgi:hypothetical protein
VPPVTRPWSWMLVVAAGRPGASADGVLVAYEPGGHEYEAEILVTLTLCGTPRSRPRLLGTMRAAESVSALSR